MPGSVAPFSRPADDVDDALDDVTVDIDQRRAIVAPFHFMGIPKLVVKRFAGHQSVLISGLSMPRVLRHSITLWLVRLMVWRYIK
jgi:hypothetical protein